MSDWNTAIVDEFRANQGKVASFGDVGLVILHTIGARTGKVREIPLAILDQDDKTYVFASAAGSPKHPDWYHNLLAQPEIDVEAGTETYRATLTPLADPQRGEVLNEQAARIPQFAEYVTNAAPRLIPVFEINRS